MAGPQFSPERTRDSLCFTAALVEKTLPLPPSYLPRLPHHIVTISIFGVSLVRIVRWRYYCKSSSGPGVTIALVLGYHIVIMGNERCHYVNAKCRSPESYLLALPKIFREETKTRDGRAPHRHTRGARLGGWEIYGDYAQTHIQNSSSSI